MNGVTALLAAMDDAVAAAAETGRAEIQAGFEEVAAKALKQALEHLKELWATLGAYWDLRKEFKHEAGQAYSIVGKRRWPRPAEVVLQLPWGQRRIRVGLCLSEIR